MLLNWTHDNKITGDARSMLIVYQKQFYGTKTYQLDFPEKILPSGYRDNKKNKWNNWEYVESAGQDNIKPCNISFKLYNYIFMFG